MVQNTFHLQFHEFSVGALQSFLLFTCSYVVLFALQPRDPNAAENVSSETKFLAYSQTGTIQHTWCLHVRHTPVGTGIHLSM